MREKIKIIQQIHLALTAGLVLAYAVLSDINSLEELFTIPNIEVNNMIYAFIPIVAFAASTFLFRNLLSKIDKKLKIEENLGAYQTALIARWAILEGAAFLIILHQPDFILFGIALIIYMITLRPTENTVKTHLSNL